MSEKPVTWPPCRECGQSVHPGASGPGGVCGKCAAKPPVIVDIPMPPRAWFSIDWTLAADTWVRSMPGRTIEMWCSLPHEARCMYATEVCEARRGSGIADPDEPTPAWALKALPPFNPPARTHSRQDVRQRLHDLVDADRVRHGRRGDGRCGGDDGVCEVRMRAITALDVPGVYCICSGGHPVRRVKIGCTTRSIKGRLAQLQVASAEPLRLLAVLSLDPADEPMFHLRFAAERRRGEWFELSEALRALILNSQHTTDGQQVLRVMPSSITKPHSGTIVKTKLGLWQPVITLADGTRKRLKAFKNGTSEAVAREKTAAYARRAIELGLIPGRAAR